MLWGTTGTTQAFAPTGADSLSIGSARLLVGGLLMVAISLVSRLRKPVPLPRGRFPGVRVPAPLAVVIAGSAVMAYQLTFFTGVRLNGVAVGTVIAIGSGPLFAGVLEWLLLGLRPGRTWLLATGCALAGLVLLVGSGGQVRLTPVGVLSSLAAGASYAAYTVATKSLLVRGWQVRDAMGAVFAVGLVLAAGVLAGTDTSWIGTPRGLLVVGWLGGGTVVGAYLLAASGLRSLPAATVATLTLLEPVTAATLGILVLGERPSAAGLAGMAAILGAVLLLTRPSGGAPPR